jgi:hypothetical protein
MRSNRQRLTVAKREVEITGAAGMRNFRLMPRCKWNRRSSGILCSVERKFRTDVSGQLIRTIINGQTSWPLKMRSVGCSEMSERHYHSTLRRIPEEGRSAARLSLQRQAALTDCFCTHLNIGFDDTQFVPRASVITAITTIAYSSGFQTFLAPFAFQQFFYGVPRPREIPNTSGY